MSFQRDRIRKRFKKELEAIKSNTNDLMEFTPETLNQFYAYIDELYKELTSLNDTGIDGHINKFDNRLEEIEQKRKDALANLFEADKQKLELYRKACGQLEKDL